MPSWAEDRFWVWLAMTLLAACSRLVPAPIEPRSAATCAMALLMSVRAAWEVAAVEGAQSGSKRAAAGSGGIAQVHVHSAGVGGVGEGFRSTVGADFQRVRGAATGQRVGCAATILGIGHNQVAGIVQGGNQAFARTVDIVDQVAHGGVAAECRRRIGRDSQTGVPVLH